ncbi:MAG: pyruvate, phosphate dikinase [Chlorobi bacterium]|nr:pyruvate, phosphate dikinase [Chlorobiota bacterium]
MVYTRQTLHNYLNRDSRTRDVYHDLNPFKVKEILLVSSLYDAYTIEREGRFSEIMLYDYGNLNLTSVPRITGVSTKKETMQQLAEKEIDMVVVMVGFNISRSIRIIKAIKEKYPDKPVFILINNRSQIKYFQENQDEIGFDRLFVWNADPRIFFAMIKYLEDLKNAENDVRLANVRIILIVEDSPEYYSAYLTSLYKVIFEQTNKIIDEIQTDKLYKVLKLRARPKILLATNYEEAKEIFEKFKNNIYMVISDVQFPKEGRIRDNAGFELIDEFRSEKPDLPVIMLSSDKDKNKLAEAKNITFLDKNDSDLYKKLQKKVIYKLGFGDFIFRNAEGKEIARASNIEEFEELVQKVPDESIMYHAQRHHFSKWLMSRSEIQLASLLKQKQATDFNNPDEIRKYILEMLKTYRDEKPSGKVIPIDEKHCHDDSNILLLAPGAFGGKGRGLAFINSLLHKTDLGRSVEGIRIKIPRTAIIGTKEFEDFIQNNNLSEIKDMNLPDEEIKKRFLQGKLSSEVKEKLWLLLDCFKKPLAIRSSGLFEDSLDQPFAGIFDTYLLPNNSPDRKKRFKQLTDAVKLVYASVFFQRSLNYSRALNKKLGEEKMAIVIEEVVGHEYDGLYYPHISGVAQSYNFYPFSDMRPDDGFAVIAIGLGSYVVEGEIAYRFSPKHPKIQMLSSKDQMKYSQTYFYAIDMTNPEPDLLQGPMASIKKVDIYDALPHGTLMHLVSTYDYNNDMMYPGAYEGGTLVVNFADILQNEYIPLAKTIQIVLKSLRDSFDTPVEIEFAVDLTPEDGGEPVFYILQVKPLIIPLEHFTVSIDQADPEKMIIYAEKSMGNGLINDIQDVIYVKNDAFDKTKTPEMAEEIDRLNRKMGEQNRQYLLIGPGRWGTRDRFIGIPVRWTQISNAKVIVETSLEGFPLDASYGSHFFHNITTLNIAYFSVFPEEGKGFIKYEKLDAAPLVEETRYFKHVRFPRPLKIIIDGRKRKAAVLEPEEEKKD